LRQQFLLFLYIDLKRTQQFRPVCSGVELSLEKLLQGCRRIIKKPWEGLKHARRNKQARKEAKGRHKAASK
jgi:hypothetical protein